MTVVQNKYVHITLAIATLTYLVWFVVWQAKILNIVDSSYFSSKALREISRSLGALTNNWKSQQH